MKAAYVTREAFDRLELSLRELSAHVVALTAVVGGIATAGAVDYERLEQCVNFAASTVRLGARPVLLAKASALLADFEKMQRALQVESRKKRGLKRSTPKTRVFAAPVRSVSRTRRFATSVARTKCRLRPDQPRVSASFRQIVARPLTGFTRRAEGAYVDLGNIAEGLAAIGVAVRRDVIARDRHRSSFRFQMPGGEKGDHGIEIVAVDGARAPGSHSGHMGRRRPSLTSAADCSLGVCPRNAWPRGWSARRRGAVRPG